MLLLRVFIFGLLLMFSMSVYVSVKFFCDLFMDDLPAVVFGLAGVIGFWGVLREIRNWSHGVVNSKAKED